MPGEARSPSSWPAPDSERGARDARRGFEMGVCGNTLVAAWRAAPTATRIHRFYDALVSLWDEHPEGVLVLNVIHQSTPLPDLEARETLARQFRQMRGKLSACAIVLEQDGVQGTLSRAVLSAISTVARQPFPMKISRHCEPAAQWLSDFEGAPPQEELIDVAQDVITRLAAEE